MRISSPDQAQNDVYADPNRWPSEGEDQLVMLLLKAPVIYCSISCSGLVTRQAVAGGPSLRATL